MTRSVVAALTTSLVLATFAADVIGMGPSEAWAIQENQYQIGLANRTFTPDEGVDPILREALKSPGTMAVPGLVQVKELPDSEERQRLADSGIELLQYLGGTAYLARFSREASLDDQMDLLRWAGPLFAEDKVEADLWAGRIHEWAVAEDGRTKVLVSFYDDVRVEEAEHLISHYTDVYARHGPSNEWALEIAQDAVRDVAASPCVRWIQQGPLPMMPLEG